MVELRLTRTLTLALALSYVTFHPVDPIYGRAQTLVGKSAGVIVEEVEKGSALEKAGLKSDDIVLAWESSSDLSGNSGINRGDLRSAFDWFWLDNEQAPKGGVRLLIQRLDKTDTLQIPAGVWHAKVRPFLSARWLKFHLRAVKAIHQGRVEEAARLWNRLAEQASTARAPDVAIWARLETARAWKQAANFDRSETSYEIAISAAVAARLARAEVDARLGITDLQILIPRLTQALESSRSAEQGAQRIAEGHVLITAMLKAKMAQILWMMADLNQAKELSDSSLLIYAQRASVSSQYSAGLNLKGMILDDMGHLREAFDLYQQALSIADKLAGRESLRAPILNNLSIVATARGDLITAEGFNQQAIAILRAKGERSVLLANLISNLGALSHARNNLDKAEILFKEGKALYDELAPKSFYVSMATLNLGQLAIERGDLDTAQRLCSDSLRFRESLFSASSFLLTSPLDCLSFIAFRRRNFAEARELEARVLSIAEAQAPGSLKVADSLGDLSSIMYEIGDLNASEAYTLRAEAIYRNLTPETDYHANALHQMALIRARQQRVAEAGEYFNRTIAALESQANRGYESEVERGAYKSSQREIYKNYVNFLLSVGKPEQAFEVLERWRAGAFLAMLNERDLVFSEVPAGLDSERRQLAVEYDRTLQKLATATSENSPAEVKAWRDRLLVLRVRQSEVAASIRRVSPKHAGLRYPQPLDFESARQSLDPQTAMLSYSLGPNETHVFAITPGQPLKVVTITLGERELSEQIQTFRKLLQESPVRLRSRTAQHGALDALSRKLFEELMAPVVSAMEDKSRLVIINDGPLHLLPWSALIVSYAQQEGAQQEGHYLADWKSIHIALSAKVYKELRELRRNRKTGETASPLLVAFGDPVYSAGIPDRATRGIGDIPLQELVERGFAFDPLPATRQEVGGITKLYGREARGYLGPAATEENAKSLPRETRIVHFATHATLDERSPLDSAVVLSIPEKFEEGKENGLLQAWEIFEQVRINADLVVLSACESGLGKELGGEGLIGLTRAFQYAGARSVMASLWKISDRTTAELMVRFYKHLKDGLPKDEALQAAQRELIHGPIQVKNEKGEVEEIDASAPYYWAAFQIYGDWQ